MEKKYKKKKLTTAQRNHIERLVKHQIFNQVFIGYKLIKIRSKISFIALKNNMTIRELFLHAILKTYQI